MITKYVNIKRVISKVFRDNDLKEGTHRVADMIEYAAEALEKIGAFPYFLIKVSGKEDTPSVAIVDYQAKLPMDAHRVLQVAYSEYVDGPFYPMRYATGTFEVFKTNSSEATTDTILSDNELVNVAMDMFNLSYADALAKLNNEPDTKELLQGILTRDTSNTLATGGGQVNSTDFTYVINGGYIKTNKKSGYLMIAYQAIPLDVDGFPMIPDDPAYMEAVYWYITMKLLYSEWKEGRVRDAVYYEARRSWNFYAKQAYGNALMPNYDELESIKNTWLRLIPNINEHDTFFTSVGQREQIYNQNSTRFNSYYEKVFYK